MGGWGRLSLEASLTLASMVKPLMLGGLVGGEVFVFQRFSAFRSSRLAGEAEVNWEQSRPRRETVWLWIA